MEKLIVLTSNTSFSIYNFRIDLIRMLKRLNYRVVVISPIDDYSIKIKKETEYIPIMNLDRKGKNPFIETLALIKYIRLYLKIKPQLVINYTIKQNIYSTIACKILGIKSISVVTGLGYIFIENYLTNKIIRRIYGLVLNLSNLIIFLNNDDKNEITKLCRNKNYIVIKGEGVNTKIFKPIENMNNKKTIFLYIGRFLKDKGLYELINASEILSQERNDFELWLLGDIDKGNPNSLTEKDILLIQSYNFIKIYKYSIDVRCILSHSDCVILPSYREGIPRTLLEAMSMEKPIITTNSPGCKEVCIHGINGYLIPPKNAYYLYLYMKKFLKLDKKRRIQMGKEGRKIVLDEFDEEIINKKICNIIKNIL